MRPGLLSTALPSQSHGGRAQLVERSCLCMKGLRGPYLASEPEYRSWEHGASE